MDFFRGTPDHYGNRRSRISVRSKQGLLVAGSITFVILAAILAIKPTPILRNNATEQDPFAAASAASAVSSAPPQTGLSSQISELEDGASSKQVTTTTFPHTVHEVANVDQWNAAVAAAEPGDVIRLVANIGSILQYRGFLAEADRGVGNGGTPERPITITANPDVWIDPGDTSNRKPALDLLHTQHVNVDGVNVRNSQFGIRVSQSNGTAESPLTITNSTVTNIGHSGIVVAGHLKTRSPSRHVRVEANTVSNTGQTASEFGEGVYIGYGATEWADQTSDVTVIGNEITQTTAEGIDVKPGTRNIRIQDNTIHDLSPISGGAISAHYVGNQANPDPDTPGNLVISGNRIWNVNLDGTPGSNDWAIWVGHGGVTITDNIIWGLRDTSKTRAIRIRALHDFGPHPIVITGNTFWTATGWVAEGSPDPRNSVQASGNKGPSSAGGVESSISPSGAPAIGSGGDADNGQGPGSALGYTPPDPNS